MSPVLDMVLRLSGVLVLVVLNAFFVAAEFGLVGSRRSRLDQMAENGNSTAALGRHMQDDMDRYIAAAQLGITLASLALGWIGESTIAALVDPPVEAAMAFVLGSFAVAETTSNVISHAIGIGISFFIITTLHIVLGEQAPKVFAIRAPERTTLFIAQPLRVFNAVFAPVIIFLDWATTMVLRLFGIQEVSSHSQVHSAEELRLLVEESGEAGVLDHEEHEMLINVLAFANRPAYQAMLPRTEVATIDQGASVREFLDRFAETGHTRFPVLGPGGVDDVKGLISAKDLLVALRDNRISFDDPIESLVREAYFTPESKRIGDLLGELRKSHVRLAVLVDEYGGMAGIVTMEDLVEEIVGEMDDEIERDEEELRTIDERTSIVDGNIRVEELNDELDLHIPQGDYETLAGYMLEQFGRLPNTGDSIDHETYHITVLEMLGPRIKRVEITRMEN